MSLLRKIRGNGTPIPPQPSLNSASLVVVAVALVCNNDTREASYPKYG
jgi:hypothetical protein